MVLALPQTWQPPAAADAAELVDPVESARAAGLRYVSDLTPGIRRTRAGKGFRYTGSDGHPMRDAETLGRIKRLAIPPAWTDVWICPDPRGHLQATGRDARGRKQYRYHPRWREVRDAVKYDRMLAFAEALPKIRQRTDRDLERHGMPLEKVLATVVRLLEETRIRIGNDEYRKENGSYGLTTLLDRQVNVVGGEVRFSFRGKSGKHHNIDLHDRGMARLIKRFLEITGEDFTAKDFRTWAGTILAARFLREATAAAVGAANSRRAKTQLVRAVARVAEELGNTPAVAKKSYIHPAVIAAYLSGALTPISENDDPDPYKLSAEERSLLALLGKAA